ncbi:MAG: hypothetical protein KKH98_14225, partial [Spirochaetes bacterium]|nr:hypothetical protein [Spirochaetota bacterium]
EDSSVKCIDLKRFSKEKLNHLIAGVLGEKEERAEKLTDFIMSKAEGNPFFTVTILRELVEEKALVWKEGYWQEDWDKIHALKISDNIIDLVIKRIDDLTEEQEKMLRVSAIIGREFELSLLYELLEYTSEAIIQLADELTQMQLIEHSKVKGKLLFVHDRIREAFLAKIDKKEARSIHLKIAQAIENKYQDRLQQYIYELAYHYTEGGDKEKSLEYIIPAAQKARKNYANEEAEKYYKIGIRLLEEKNKRGSSEWITANEDLSDVYLVIGKNDEGIKVVNILLRYKKDKIAKAALYRKMGLAYFRKGEYAKCEQIITSGLSLLGIKIPLKSWEVKLSVVKGLSVNLLHNFFPFIYKRKEVKEVSEKDKEIIWSYFVLNFMYAFYDLFKCVSNILNMINFTESRFGKSRELGVSIATYAGMLSVIPLFKLSYKFQLKGIQMNREIKDQWNTARSLNFLGLYYYFKGEHENCVKTSLESLEMFRKMGDLWEVAIDLNSLGHATRYLGQYEYSMGYFREYLEISQKIGDYYGESSCMSYLAFSLIEKGDFDQAEKWNKRSLKLSREKKILYNICFGFIHMGYLYLEKGDIKKAISFLEKARELYDKNQFLKDWTVCLFYLIADAYIIFHNLHASGYNSHQRKRSLKKIRKACRRAFWQTKMWVNHHGAALRVIGKYHALCNRNSKAQKYFLKSIRQTEFYKRKYETAKGYYEYGLFLRSLQKEEAQEKFQRAYEVFREIGAIKYIQLCSDILDIQVTGEDETTITSQDRLKLERKMATVLGASRNLSSILKLDELLDRIMTSTIELVGAERGALYLYPEKEEGSVRVPELELKV